MFFFLQYKTEIKKQTGIKVDTTKQIDKLQADITRTQTNYTTLEKTDVIHGLFFFLARQIFVVHLCSLE